MRFSDRLLGLLFGALGVIYFALTLDFPGFPGQRYGPALFPRVLAVGLVASSLVLFFRRPRQAAGEPAVRIAPALREPGALVKFSAIPVAVAFYLLAAERLGFVPTAFLVLLGLMLLFRVSAWKALLVAAIATGAVHWFFATMMRVPLPRGLFMQIVAGG